MNEVPLAILFAALLGLIVLSAFFSASGTGMMTLNRYRLKHLANNGHPGARRAGQLLERPDRLISLILIGNHLVNALAAVLATLIAIRLMGGLDGPDVAALALLLGLALLVFAEIAPRIVAALHPERIAFPASAALLPLLKICQPLVWLAQVATNGLLRLCGAPVRAIDAPLSSEELRNVVNEAGQLIPRQHQGMLLSILELEQVIVDDIMLPRNKLPGLNLDAGDADILAELRRCDHTHIPVYRENINDIVGVLRIACIGRILSGGHLDRNALLREICEPYFIPSGTPLQTQLLNFQKSRQQMGMVVDEYGDVQGAVTLEDVLAEIIGEFNASPLGTCQDVLAQNDGSYLVDARATIREINRSLDWQLPTDGPRTLNGLLLEHLEAFPAACAGMRIGPYHFEIAELKNRLIQQVRVWRQE